VYLSIFVGFNEEIGRDDMIVATVAAQAASGTWIQPLDTLAEAFEFQVIEFQHMLYALPAQVGKVVPVALEQRYQLIAHRSVIVAPGLQGQAFAQVAPSHPGRVHLLQDGRQQALQLLLAGLDVLIDVQFIGNLMERRAQQAIIGQGTYQILHHLQFVVGKVVFTQLSYQIVEERLRSIAQFATALLLVAVARFAGNAVVEVVVIGRWVEWG